MTPTTAYGDAEILHFFRHSISLLDTQIAWIRFDEFDSHLPPEAEIISARLALMGAGEDSPSVNPKSYGRVGVMLAAWSTNMTFNTRISSYQFYGDPGYSSAWPTNTWAWFDLTTAARAWRRGELGNNGIVLHGKFDNANGYKERTAYSSKAAIISRRPALELDFIVPGAGLADGRPVHWSVVATNGPTVIEDTAVLSGTYATANFVNRDSVSLGTWNNVAKPERALLRILMDHPVLEDLARSDESASGKPVLAGAWLDCSLLSCQRNTHVDIWQVDPEQDWQAASVTAHTRDGVTAWVEPLTNRVVDNVVLPYVNRATIQSQFQAGTVRLDITPAMQQHIDGTNNTGFLIGHSGSYPYFMSLALSEQTRPFMRPTLMLVTRTPRTVGSVVLVQ